MSPTTTLPWVAEPIHTYNLVLAVYFPLAVWVTAAGARPRGVDPALILRLAIVGVPAGIIGARMLDMLEYWGRYTSLSDALGRQGSSIYGGMFAMLLVVSGLGRLYRTPAAKLLDAGAPAMALGEAMSRIGCFLNGCCYGTSSARPWAVTFPAESFAYVDQQARGILPSGAPRSLPVHPVQLYSCAIMLAVFVYLLRQRMRPFRDGNAIFLFLTAYGTLRLAMAPFRTEALLTMKVFSLVFVVAGVVGLLATRNEVVTMKSVRVVT